MSSIEAIGVALAGTIDLTVPYKLLFRPWFPYIFIMTPKALELTLYHKVTMKKAREIIEHNSVI